MIIVDIILNIAYYIIHIYAICIIVSGILSFVGANPLNPIVTFFRVITAPPSRMLLEKFPRLLIRTASGFLDLSPLIVLLILGCLMIIIEKIAFYLGIYI